MQAKWYTKVTKPRDVRLIVVHDMEYPERTTAAEDIARDFATRPASSKASAHICVDNNSIVQCVRDNDVAYAAPGANHDGIQVELAGYAKQTRADWMDPYSFAMLHRAADAVAQYTLKYRLPPIHLSNAELKAGAAGIVAHSQVSQVYKKSNHMDVGLFFPWDAFILMVQSARVLRLPR